ncbi:MAG: glycosyltransferase 87 family protein, partial [Chloroflexota bacterium]|nr:glycosyltransferase 87 family protein [Chloroflexota bacterium]
MALSADLFRPSAWRSSLARNLHGEGLRRAAVNLGFVAVVAFLGAHHPRLSYLFARDAHAYWAVNMANPYDKLVGQVDAYLYSPAFAQFLIAPLQGLAFPLFYAVVTAANVAALVYLLGRFRALIALAAVSPVAIDIWYGNIHLLMALAIVLGFRYPAAWSLLLLTKITPGVGLLWFALRREWRSFALAVGATAAIAAVSFVLAPG